MKFETSLHSSLYFVTKKSQLFFFPFHPLEKEWISFLESIKWRFFCICPFLTLFVIILQSAQHYSALKGWSPVIPLELIIITAIILNPFSLNVDVNYSHVAFLPLVLLPPASTLIWITQGLLRPNYCSVHNWFFFFFAISFHPGQRGSSRVQVTRSVIRFGFTLTMQNFLSSRILIISF